MHAHLHARYQDWRLVLRRIVVVLLVALALAASSSAQITSRYVGAGYVLVTGPLGLIHKRTPTPPHDHVFYAPATGVVVVGITQHPQRSGYNGSVFAPGDCWAAFDSGVLHADSVRLMDADGDGAQNDLVLYRSSDGLLVTVSISLSWIFPGCDTSDI